MTCSRPVNSPPCRKARDREETGASLRPTSLLLNTFGASSSRRAEPTTVPGDRGRTVPAEVPFIHPREEKLGSASIAGLSRSMSRPQKPVGMNLMRILTFCAVLVLIGMLSAVLVILEQSPTHKESLELQQKIDEYQSRLSKAEEREVELKRQIQLGGQTKSNGAPVATPSNKVVGLSPIPKILHLIWISFEGEAPPLPASVAGRAKFMKETHEKIGWEVIAHASQTCDTVEQTDESLVRLILQPLRR